MFLGIGLVAVLCSCGATWLARDLARAHSLVDVPTRAKPGIHTQLTPLLGGAAVYATFVALIFGAYFFLDIFDQSTILPKHLFGLAMGGALLMIGGYLDDRFRLPPKKQLIAPLAAVVVVMVSGIGVVFITNPFGGLLRLDSLVITLVQTPSIHWKITVWADLFTLVWLMGMMYTTKLLDGLDGLATGVTLLATLVLFAISLMAEVPQYDTALLATIFAGVLFGFLLWNFYPAKIFLGEGGSLFLGYILALLAIIAGAKVTATLMVMALPIIDVARVVIVRKFIRHTRVSQGDFGHLHHAFLRRGFSHMQTVLLFYAVTFLLGIAALALQFATVRAPHADLPSGKVRIADRVELAVEIADNQKTRRQGLSGRAALTPDAGMLFVFEKPDAYTFWMQNMHFPLDVIWLRGGRVVGLQADVLPPRTQDSRPQTFSPPEPVDSVLEVSAGFIAHHGVRIGDTVAYRASP